MASVGPGDVVLDPFVGSGALLVGARELGAHVIGCDIAPAAVRQANAKLSSTRATGKPGGSASRRARTPDLGDARPARSGATRPTMLSAWQGN
jgi:DNA modification methylase